MKNEAKKVNFLRGVPADEALAHLIPLVAEGYERAVKHHGTNVLQYGHFSGFQRLREIIAARHHTEPKRVIVGNGGMEMISLFFKSLPNQSTILIEESTYDRVVFDAGRYGHKLIGIRMNSMGLDIDKLDETASQVKAAAFYGIPFHHNPTGINYALANRQAVEETCRQHKMLCVWDICYEPLRYDGRENEPISLANDGPILISSFTKTISPGTKCGYIVLPADRMEFMEKVVVNSRLNPNLPTQAFVADFIESGQYDKYLAFLRHLYKPRMESLNAAGRSFFPSAFTSGISGGFFVTIQLPGIMADKEQAFLAAAKEAGVSIAAAWGAVAPNLLAEKRGAGLLLRLPFPANNAEQIAWGLARLKEVANSF